MQIMSPGNFDRKYYSILLLTQYKYLLNGHLNE